MVYTYDVPPNQILTAQLGVNEGFQKHGYNGVYVAGGACAHLGGFGIRALHPTLHGAIIREIIIPIRLQLHPNKKRAVIMGTCQIISTSFYSFCFSGVGAWKPTWSHCVVGVSRVPVMKGHVADKAGRQLRDRMLENQDMSQVCGAATSVISVQHRHMIYPYLGDIALAHT